MNLSQSGEKMELLAPAKLNLFLELLARRDDGFHEIETLMVAVNIFDTLRITSKSKGQLQLCCRWAGGYDASFHTDEPFLSQPDSVSHGRAGLPAAEKDNLVWQAVEKLRLRAGAELGASIELIKRIPVAAGLGGASSDAAAALIAANHVWQLGRSRQQLAEIAAELGSDVPFFLDGGVAVCRGRGERMESVAGVCRMNFVVVQPPGGLSTRQVYQHCRVPKKSCRVEPLVEAACRGRLANVGQFMTNRLQQPAADLSPWIERTHGQFQQLDVLGHQMSGSGTSYFGLCRNARHARRVACQLRGRIEGTIFCVHGLPAHRRL